jgi:uncharacterized membrane protein YiaA
MENNSYLDQLAEIRSMMERSTKFMSLAGWAGVLAGVYALLGTYLVHFVYGFQPDRYDYPFSYNIGFMNLPMVVVIAIIVLIFALGSAIVLSVLKARKKGDKIWNVASKQLVADMLIPLVSGGVLVIILWNAGLSGLAAPLTLIFYGLALYQAGRYTFREVRTLGLIQIALGLTGALFVDQSILLWAAGFGLMHILYGIYLYLKYER